MANISRRSNDRKPSEIYVAVAMALGILTASHAVAQTAAPVAKPEAKKAETAAETAQAAAKRAEAEANAGGLETIVVTAQRREERAQTVPIAMSAFSGAALERRNITDALTLTQYVPNIVATNNTGLKTANTYFIRGVGDGESLASKDPPVGTYIDDIFIARVSANNFTYFDVDRIEVLRGPQGTLFGRNTTGGAFNVFLKKPTATMKGYAELGTGSFNKAMLRAGIDVPFTPSVMTKLSAFGTEDRGYVKNTITGEWLNGQKDSGGRFSVRALASDTITWDAFATYLSASGTNVANFTCDPVSPTNCSGRYATTGLRVNNNGASQYPTLTISDGKANLPFGNETTTSIVGSNLALDLGRAKVNLITGYVNTKQSYDIDFFDGRAAPGVTFAADPVTGRPSVYNVTGNVTSGGVVRGRPGAFALLAFAESKQFTQEVKVTGNAWGSFIDYVGGFFYFNEKNYSNYADILTGTGAAAAPPAAPYAVTLLADRTLRNTTAASAAYMQADFNITPQVKFTAGTRFTIEDKEYNFSDNRPICQTTPVAATCLDNANFVNNDIDLNPATPGVTIPRTQSIKIWTPRFALNYKPTDDMLLYASATRGFKSGGQSARATSVRFLLPFDAEKVWSYEVGARTEWLDRRLRLNLTGFYALTKDFQGGSAFVTTNTVTGAQSLTFVTRNFADLENKGIEFDLTAVPIKGLNLFVTGGTQDAKYKIDPNRFDTYGTVPAVAQQQECRAALAGVASLRGDTRTAVARAQSSCANGVVTPTGDIAKPVRTPKLTISAGASYDIQLDALAASVTPSVNVSYIAAHETGTTNISIWRNAAGVLNAVRDGEYVTGSYSASHTIVNGGVSFRTNDKLWSGSLNCANCTNKSYTTASLSNFSYLNPPRMWTFNVKRVF